MKPHLINFSKLNRLIQTDVLRNKALLPQNLYGLVTTKPFFFYEKHLAALLRVLKFHFKRKRKTGCFMLNVFFNTFITGKAIGVRMGKGKGAKRGLVYFARPGTTLITLNDSDCIRARYIMSKCARRLPVLCKLVFYNC
jgi:ribosomal protein L16/L10AE